MGVRFFKETDMKLVGTRPASEVRRSDDKQKRTRERGAIAEAPVRGGADTPLATHVVQPAMAALRDMPDFDEARVAALREALKAGELPFDAGKLACLIQRFHGTRGRER